MQEPMNLEATTDKDEENNDEGGKEEVPEITEEEVQTAINKLKKGKASDNN